MIRFTKNGYCPSSLQRDESAPLGRGKAEPIVMIAGKYLNQVDTPLKVYIKIYQPALTVKK
jgi:hypothetical protein